ncbi:hypothetical protein BX616_011300 [Lobosporangium transversale]|uniref:Uncharacterized protein n=1 Tax=Lobosporangium transversale TaxID=64571 RepID=A0A1Y2GDF9_9FUNG|nr:hypothetical protein BCR41DRAFT_191397 [Lobosporangium transversale]KAF9909087.1 hypothetical protein BX616_011300 [Lobosporangium transversale]ORZ04796.1 hypothetical protein BCR41DRAFT_191397 [Lobosporangium transversale]|eukprot:XP_021876733.1 hypothetical protein BCR41DRAFT_191397 [Lobosporangium transversale]
MAHHYFPIADLKKALALLKPVTSTALVSQATTPALDVTKAALNRALTLPKPVAPTVSVLQATGGATPTLEVTKAALNKALTLPKPVAPTALASETAGGAFATSVLETMETALYKEALALSSLAPPIARASERVSTIAVVPAARAPPATPEIAVPVTPSPPAPMDWRTAQVEPVVTVPPYVDINAAAKLPPVIPAALKPMLATAPVTMTGAITAPATAATPIAAAFPNIDMLLLLFKERKERVKRRERLSFCQFSRALLVNLFSLGISPVAHLHFCSEANVYGKMLSSIHRAMLQRVILIAILMKESVKNDGEMNNESKIRAQRKNEERGMACGFF